MKSVLMQEPVCLSLPLAVTSEGQIRRAPATGDPAVGSWSGSFCRQLGGRELRAEEVGGDWWVLSRVPLVPQACWPGGRASTGCVCRCLSARWEGPCLNCWFGLGCSIRSNPAWGISAIPPPTRFKLAVGMTSSVTLGWLPESLGPCINENPPSSVASAGLSPQGPQTAQSLLEITEPGQIMDSAVKGPGCKSPLCHLLPV